MSSKTSSDNPLKDTLYRFLWITMFASDIGASMQTVGSGWLMTSLALSPFVVSLLQMVTSLSIFLFALPAGALADIADRRKLFLVTQYFSLAVAAVLSILTFVGYTTSSILLVFTFLLGIGNAMSLPVNIVVQTEIVPKKKVLAAMTLFSVAIFIGFAVGPLLGGFVVALVGPWAVFALNALSFVGIIVFLHRWHKPSEHRPLPPEQVIGAIRTGLRYMRHSLHVRALFVRDFTLTVCTSAAVSLLPLLARSDAGSNSILFGILVSAFGIGGLISGLIIVPRIKKMSIEKRVTSATILYAIAMGVLAFRHDTVTLFLGVFTVGSALIVMTSSLNFVAYNSSDFVSKIGTAVGLSEKAKRDALNILHHSKEKHITDGKNPVSLAAAALFISGIMNDEVATQKKLSEIAGVSTVTVRNVSKVMKKSLGI